MSIVSYKLWDALARHGEDVMLSRPKRNPDKTLGRDLVTCAARVVRGDALTTEPLVGNIEQGNMVVIISNEEILRNEWPGPPKREDQVVIRGKTYTVQRVNSLSDAGEYCRHELTVEGP